MGTIQFYEAPDTDTMVGLYDHEGYLAFLDAATGEWSSTWGADALGAPGHDPIRVHAECDCGWVGPDLPWSAAEDYPDEERHDFLMVPWDRHVNAIVASRRASS